ncbi:hypothetical protein AVEN_149375-1 [Araneus ventricosus]|uniref:Uncharacterized protein n=1 Tax=Araneus ventricosus TaxID=182803 RepID=A0A4Y2WID4_ARAVE|nr:hypothetical protein AVEN_149375-1 [Araneus ventricosus]
MQSRPLPLSYTPDDRRRQTANSKNRASNEEKTVKIEECLWSAGIRRAFHMQSERSPLATPPTTGSVQTATVKSTTVMKKKSKIGMHSGWGSDPGPFTCKRTLYH